MVFPGVTEPFPSAAAIHGAAVPFSYKRRGFCPSCCGRHMASTAVLLVVLTLPFELRKSAAYDPELCSAPLSLIARQLKRWTRENAREHGVERPVWGGLSVTHVSGPISVSILTSHDDSRRCVWLEYRGRHREVCASAGAFNRRGGGNRRPHSQILRSAVPPAWTAGR